MSGQPTLWAPPAPPSGPVCDVRQHCTHTYHDYVRWKGTLEGVRAWRYVERCALDAAARGDERIATKTLVEIARRKLRVPINNNWTARIADDLVARHPHLLTLIERRRRRAND